MQDLALSYNLNTNSLGHLTSAVQLGFILGTLCFAILTITDRFSPSKVFLWSALLGAFFNLGLLWHNNTFLSILLFRALTGFFLAGIYPVGMKIAADYFNAGLGTSLGFLVGALVLGTASPHLLKDLSTSFDWDVVIICISTLAATGGLLMFLLVPNGPYRKANQSLELKAFFKVFNNGKFRASAFGYFGHMWELYAFWAFIPVLLHSYKSAHTNTNFNTSLWSFTIIAIGSLSCVLGGYVSKKYSTKTVASMALGLSGLCCLLVPWVSHVASPTVFLVFLLFWGMVVIADSPLFSTMVAHNAEPKIKGTALTTVNCIGFSITILSIQLLNALQDSDPANYRFMLLALGPILGLWALRNSSKSITD